mmetsp:Transcript_13226/g.26443  ORF Transcript_13226/g.26443 Transcript_13226/m.26443 type:complete len:115 (-) Transcript_13226:154-498(-)
MPAIMIVLVAGVAYYYRKRKLRRKAERLAKQAHPDVDDDSVGSQSLSGSTLFGGSPTSTVATGFSSSSAKSSRSARHFFKRSVVISSSASGPSLGGEEALMGGDAAFAAYVACV